MNPAYHIYGVGNALVDTEIEVDDTFLNTAGIEKGLMTLVDEERQHKLLELLADHLVASKRASGGSAANTIIAASCFGSRAFYSCKVANDDNGHFYLADLEKAGVDSNFHSERQQGITGKCLVMITPDAERTMNTYLGITETFSTAELNIDALRASQYLYIEGYLVTSPTGRAAAIEARQTAVKHQVKTAMSFSDPGIVEHFKDGLRDMAGNRLDMLFCNEAEAMSWTNTTTVELAAEALKDTAECFAITLGARGALIFDGTSLHQIAGHPTKAIDTNGAGDMFAGAFLHALCQGWGYVEAGKFACQAAATVVSQFGPRFPIEKHQEVIRQYRNDS